MPLFKCRVDEEEKTLDNLANQLQTTPNNHDSQMKIKEGTRSLKNIKNSKKAPQRLSDQFNNGDQDEISDIIPREILIDNIFVFISSNILLTKTRLICKRWNEMILSHDLYNCFFSLSVNFGRNKIKSDAFCVAVERGVLRNVKHLQLFSLHHEKKKIVMGNNIIFLPGKTIVSRGYQYKSNVGGNILKYLPNLVSLDLEGNEIEVERHNWLLDLKSPSIENLNLSDNGFGSVICQHISECANFVNLIRLNLSFNNIGNEGCKYLGRAFSLERLEYLDISMNEITMEGLIQISNAPFSNTLLELNASNNSGIGSLFNTSITDSQFTFSKLSTLFVLNCGIQESTVLLDNLHLVSPHLKRVLI